MAWLQARVGRGEYNLANSRVLHYVHNPEAEARREHEAARISELEAESATLRAQLQALQPREAGVEPESVATSVAAAEKTVLEQKVWHHTNRHIPKGKYAHIRAKGGRKLSRCMYKCQT